MSKISNYKWAMLVGVAFILDILQLALDGLGVGIFLNPPFDIFIGFALQRYFKKQGVKGNWKQWIAWIGAPALEFFTASIFPLGWVLEVIATMLIDKAEGRVVGAIESKNDEGDQNKKAA